MIDILILAFLFIHW